MSRVRIRQHVNPLSERFREQVTLPDWSRIYPHLEQPLHLDIGSARGKFLLKMAAQFPEINFLGTEIRQPLVEEANSLRDELGLSNLHFFFCNINTSARNLLNSLPVGYLQVVSIQFPDPWFKRSHRKRRVVQPELVQAIADFLAPQGWVFLQSDIEAVATEMRQRFQENPVFQIAPQFTGETSLFPVPTEREIATQRKNLPVYRSVLVKNNPPLTATTSHSTLLLRRRYPLYDHQNTDKNNNCTQSRSPSPPLPSPNLEPL